MLRPTTEQPAGADADVQPVTDARGEPQIDPRPSRPAGGPGGVWAAAFAVGLFAAWIGSGLGGRTVVRYVDDLGTAAAAATAAVACTRAALRHDGRIRLFWSLVAGAAAAWSIGELLWALYELILREPVPVSSWADAGYLAAIPLAAAALLVHPAMRGRSTGKTRALLDGLVIATALFFPTWTLLLGPLWHTTDLTTRGGLVALAYPLGDLVVVFLVVLAIRGTSTRARLDLWYLLAGLLAITCSDVVYGYLSEIKGYTTGNLIDTGWVAGYLAIAVAARCAHADETSERSPIRSALSPVAIVAPFLPMLAALSFASIRLQLGHRLDRVGLTTAFALVVLVLVRQTLLAVDLLRRERSDDAPIERRLLAAVGAATPSVRSRQ